MTFICTLVLPIDFTFQFDAKFPKKGSTSLLKSFRVNSGLSIRPDHGSTPLRTCAAEIKAHILTSFKDAEVIEAFTEYILSKMLLSKILSSTQSEVQNTAGVFACSFEMGKTFSHAEHPPGPFR